MRFLWRRKDLELEREVGHHLHHLTAEYERQGYAHQEAVEMAKREFGGPEQVKEQCRDERRGAWLTSVWQDVVFGFRIMRHTPVTTTAAVLSLALGIGANTAIISLMDVVLWRDLPVPNPQQLSLVHWRGQGFPRDLADSAAGSIRAEGGAQVADFFSYTSFEAMRKGAANHVTVAAFQFPRTVSLSFDGRATVGRQRPVSGNFFSVLQTHPALGRLLSSSDDTDSAPPAVVLSHRFWVSVISSDPSVIGKTIGIDNKPHTVAGVLEPEFYGLVPGDGTDIYAPLRLSGMSEMGSTRPVLNDRFWNVSLLARRKGAIDDRQLQTLLNDLFHASWKKPPKDWAKAPAIQLDGGSRGLGFLRRDFRNPLWVLGGMVALLLVIACANIANLLLARAVARHREVTVRVALGCSRRRLIRQFLTESVILAAMGGAASIVVGFLTANFLGHFLVAHDGRPVAVALDPRLVLIVGASTALALLLFGIFPAFYGSRLAKATWGRPGASGLSQSGGHKWGAGRLLVVAQMSLSVVLVLAAVILTKNLITIQSSDPGFDRRDLVLFGVRPGTSGYDKARLPSFYFQLEKRLESTPGVAAVGMASIRPMNVGGWWEGVRLAGQTGMNQASINGVTPGYLPVYASRLIAGRNITQSDIDSAARVAVVSEDLARKLGGQSVLGQILEFPDGPPGAKPKQFQIVGISPTIAVTSMQERPYAVWLPVENDLPERTIVIRTVQSPQIVLPAIRQTMREVDSNLPLVDLMTMEEQIGVGLQRERMFASLCSGFGILALVLSAVGLYGVIAYSTSRRKGEIGVRMALGAQRNDVVWMVLRDGMGMAALGIVIGIPIVLFASKYAEKLVAELKALDLFSAAVALSVLLLAAFVAVAIPAIRASYLEPAEALRQE